jgi:bacteriorhodopsin
MNLATGTGTEIVMAICPQAPQGAQKFADQITGNVLWGVLALFVVGVITGVGAVVAGRVFAMPHASKVGVISIVVVFLAAIAYMVVPGMVSGITGSGCV